MKKHDPFIAGGSLPKNKVNPIALAKHYLNLVNHPPRLIEKDSGFWLDGLPASITAIMRTTNRLRLQDKRTQIDYNPEWRVAEIIPFRPFP